MVSSQNGFWMLSKQWKVRRRYAMKTVNDIVVKVNSYLETKENLKHAFSHNAPSAYDTIINSNLFSTPR